MSDPDIDRHSDNVLNDIRLRRFEHMAKWPPWHDDGHKAKELAWAAATFLNVEDWHAVPQQPGEFVCVSWPFDEPFRPRLTYRENLIEAAALIVAEIERIDRATTTT